LIAVVRRRRRRAPSTPTPPASPVPANRTHRGPHRGSRMRFATENAIPGRARADGHAAISRMMASR
jgi:hypothetical protein